MRKRGRRKLWRLRGRDRPRKERFLRRRLKMPRKKLKRPKKE